jgi:hypothetical protein
MRYALFAMQKLTSICRGGGESFRNYIKLKFTRCYLSSAVLKCAFEYFALFFCMFGCVFQALVGTLFKQWDVRKPEANVPNFWSQCTDLVTTFEARDPTNKSHRMYFSFRSMMPWCDLRENFLTISQS